MVNAWRGEDILKLLESLSQEVMTEKARDASNYSTPENKGNNIMNEKNLPIETNVNVDEIQSTLKDVLIMDEFPDDKEVEILVEFVVVPKTMKVKISKK